MSEVLEEIHNTLHEVEELLATANDEMRSDREAFEQSLAEREEKIEDLEGLLKLRKWQIAETQKENENLEGKVGKLETLEENIEEIEDMTKKDWVRIKELMDALDDLMDQTKGVKRKLKQMHVDIETSEGGST